MQHGVGIALLTIDRQTHVARIDRHKGHRDLLESVALLRRENGLPPFRLVLVGDGIERDRLAAQARELNIEDIYRPAGHRSDVRPYYAMAAAVALPSHSEGSPNVVLEGMAAGVPLAATAVGGVPEILEDGVNGLVVPPRNPAAMASALGRLLRDEGLRSRLAAAARERVERDFTPEAYRDSMIRFYRQVLTDYQARGG